MGGTRIPAEINHDRRRFFGAAAVAVAAAELGLIGSADAQAGTLPTIRAGTNTSFPSLKQIDAGLLNVGYAEAGPAEGRSVILLHGWPDEPQRPSSPCRPSPLKVTPTVLPIWRQVRMPGNSRANTRTRSSKAVSATIFLRKRRRPLPKPLLLSTVIDFSPRATVT
jgi:hypothetical protein